MWAFRCWPRTFGHAGLTSRAHWKPGLDHRNDSSYRRDGRRRCTPHCKPLRTAVWERDGGDPNHVRLQCPVSCQYLAGPSYMVAGCGWCSHAVCAVARYGPRGRELSACGSGRQGPGMGAPNHSGCDNLGSGSFWRPSLTKSAPNVASASPRNGNHNIERVALDFKVFVACQLGV